MEPLPVDSGSPSVPPHNPLRKTDVRKQTRPTLLPSRTNSRPDLARYTSGSSLHSSNSLNMSLGRSSGRVLAQSQQVDVRRERIIERVMALKHGAVEDKEKEIYSRISLQGAQDVAPTPKEDAQECANGGEGANAHTGGKGAYNYVEPGAYAEEAGLGGYATVSVQSQPFLQVGAVDQLDRFHRMLDELRGGEGYAWTSMLNTGQKAQRYDQLVSMMNEFQVRCETYSKVLILEAHLPDEMKTIKPLNSNKAGGVLGGLKFLVNGVFIKFACDKQGIYGGKQESASKVALHEVKSLTAVLDAAVPGLRFPLICTVTYLGHSLLCLSHLPIDGTRTLRYGSADAGKTIHFDDPKAFALANALGEKLNLKPHSPRGHPEITVRLPMDIEIHLGLDGHYYMLDFSRLFPCVPVDRSLKGSQFFRLFRKEFVTNYAIPLSPDSYSGFTDNADQCQSMQACVAAKSFLDTLIQRFGQELSERRIPSRDVDREHSLTFLSVRLHIAGINTRYLGDVRKNTVTPYWRLLLLVGMISRRLKALLEEELRAAHSRGASGVTAFLHFVNTVFGATDESMTYWAATIVPSVMTYFGAQPDVNPQGFKAQFFSEENDEVLREPVVLRLLKEFLKKISMEFPERTMQHYTCNTRSILSVAEPFDTTDIFELGITVSHLPVVFFAGAKVKRLAAMKSSDARAWNLYTGAAQLFFKALHGFPSDPVGLRNLGTCLSFLDERDAALEYFNLALKCAKGRDGECKAQTYYKLACMHDSQFDWEKAEDCYLLSLELEYSDHLPSPHRLATYADFLFSRGNLEAAIKLYECALHLQPSNGETMHNLAVVYSATGDKDKAAAQFQLALTHCASDKTTYARVCRNAAVFFEDQNTTVARALWSTFEASDNLALLGAMRGPNFFHATNSLSEITEVKSIYGPRRQYKVRQLRLDYTQFQLRKEGVTAVQAAVEKVERVHEMVSYPVSTEVVYIKPERGDLLFGSAFDEIGAEEFARIFLGQAVRVGVVVAFHSGTKVSTYESWVDGVVVQPKPAGHGWDRCVLLPELNKALCEFDQLFKSYVNFRRVAYLKLWCDQFGVAD